ncbi:MAG: PDZ domain-containing protein [Clostridia bacterium]|nr:PDZ domain-containing protein [Clostridia bacterium]
MKKRISIGTLIASCLIVAILTFQVTFILTMNTISDRYSENAAIKEQSSEFMDKVVEKLSSLDEAYREMYIGELDDDTLIDYILKGYVVGTGDPYGAYYNDEELEAFMSDLSGETEGIGVSVIYNADMGCIEIINVVPDSPALEAGLQPGDLIAFVGEEKIPVAELGYDTSVARLSGEAGTEAIFYAYKGGDTTKLTEFRITRAKVTGVSVMYHVCELDDSVGIVKITSFDATTYDQFTEAIDTLTDEGCERFIFDLRYNPGGELNAVVDVLDYLLPAGPVIRIFDAEDNLVKQMDSDKNCVDFEMAVLVNGSTASAAELFTSALMDYEKATVVGETTYGKGCMQTTFPLDEGGAMKITYRMYKPPFSEGYHEVGITPDIEVVLDEALADKNIYKITDSEDNQLKAALDAITK